MSQKSLHQMSGWGASSQPSAAFEEEQAWQATRQVSPATQVMHAAEDDEPQSVPLLGRRLTDSQWEMFVACEPADALMQHFESARPEFIVLHDIGGQSARRMLQGLALAMRRPVQQLHVRRQGVGMPMARIEFIELPVPGDDPPLRLYVSETDADTAQRRRLARTLLSYSRLAVVMVHELPPHALATALMPLRDAIVEGPWSNSELLMLPLAGAASLAGAAAQLGRGASAKIRTTPTVTRPAEAWAYLRAAWNGLRRTLADQAVILPELLELTATSAPTATSTPMPAVSAAAAEMPIIAARPTTVPAALSATPASAAGAARTPLPMQPMPTVRAAAPTASPADPLLSTYLRKCGELKGMISCCIFELATQRTVGHLGTRPGPAGLAAHGASLMASMAEAAHGLNLGDAAPDAAITLAHHHVLLRAVPMRQGLAMHAVLDKSQANLTLIRLQLQRLDLILEEGTPP